jgi:acetyltransferase-like isoleucine patch superfamily enzyme
MKVHKINTNGVDEPLRFIDFVEDTNRSAAAKYKSVVVGEQTYRYLAKYEILQMLFSGMPGALGLILRRKFYQGLFLKMGKDVTIGRNVCLRQPCQMSIGSGTVIDDYARLVVAGSKGAQISIGMNVFLGAFSVCSSKGSDVSIGDYCSIGSHSRIVSMDGRVAVGQYVLIGAYCYIGGGNHSAGDLATPIVRQEFDSRGGVTIGDNVWIGGHVVVLDGVTIGEGAIIGAFSLVTRDIPANSIAYGLPAKVQKTRGA